MAVNDFWAPEIEGNGCHNCGSILVKINHFPWCEWCNCFERVNTVNVRDVLVALDVEPTEDNLDVLDHLVAEAYDEGYEEGYSMAESDLDC